MNNRKWVNISNNKNMLEIKFSDELELDISDLDNIE